MPERRAASHSRRSSLPQTTSKLSIGSSPAEELRQLCAHPDIRERIVCAGRVDAERGAQIRQLVALKRCAALPERELDRVQDLRMRGQKSAAPLEHGLQ